MKKLMLVMMAAVLAGGLAGCGRSSIFDGRYAPYRADFGDEPIPAPPPSQPKVDLVNPDPVPGIAPQVVEQVTGTWTFVTPPTVTRVERKTSEFSQFSLYMGRPNAGDLPFVVITVSPEQKGLAETDTENYQIANSRTYALNGNVCQEWTGTTKNGRGFCELLIRKPGDRPGDVCHALATVKTTEEQKLALEILGSITWAANPNAATPAGTP
jgi:hypothetical protein